MFPKGEKTQSKEAEIRGLRYQIHAPNQNQNQNRNLIGGEKKVSSSVLLRIIFRNNENILGVIQTFHLKSFLNKRWIKYATPRKRLFEKTTTKLGVSPLANPISFHPLSKQKLLSCLKFFFSIPFIFPNVFPSFSLSPNTLSHCIYTRL